MKLGFVTAILGDLTLEEVVRFAAETGYDCVEVMCWPVGDADRRYAGVTHLDVTGFSAEDANSVQQMLDQYGVSISGLGYYPNPLTSNPAVADVYAEHLKRVIEAASVLGVNLVNSFVGRDHTRSVDEKFQFLRARLAWNRGIRGCSRRSDRN